LTIYLKRRAPADAGSQVARHEIGTDWGSTSNLQQVDRVAAGFGVDNARRISLTWNGQRHSMDIKVIPGRWTPDNRQLSLNIEAVANWNRVAFEIPDIIGFEDYRRFARSIAEDLAAAPDRPSGALITLPYPNFKPDKPDNLRQMAVVAAPDLALLRADAGLIIKVTDSLLSDSVCSYRLNPSMPPGTAWSFDDRNPWRKRFIAGGMQMLDEAAFPFMCRTDISKLLSIDPAWSPAGVAADERLRRVFSRF
jgi:predicted alpha/beta-hydrolase family hydrolase